MCENIKIALFIMRQKLDDNKGLAGLINQVILLKMAYIKWREYTSECSQLKKQIKI